MKDVNIKDFNTISPKLKERFCKDCNIPINVFQEPYFSERLYLYDSYMNTINKWATFVREFDKYQTEQDYFEHYNRVKDNAIDFIKSTVGFQEFNDDNMRVYADMVKEYKLPAKDIYHPDNDRKYFISIDMKQANFSALSFYHAGIFDYANTWEEFIGKFTDNKHIINSKYIRQVILGNCNSKKHITFEKYLMNIMLTYLLNNNIFTIDRVVFFSNDEIVIDVTDMSYLDQIALTLCIDNHMCNKALTFKVELFELHQIKGTHGYYKLIINLKDGTNDIKFKCVDALYMPMIMRQMLGDEIHEYDKVFYHNGLLAKFIETPKIEGDLL